MKKALLSSLFFIFWTLSLFSQIKPTVSETEVSILGKSMKGFLTTVPISKPDDVKKSWIKSIEKGTKSKAELFEGSEILIYDALIKEISDSSMTIFSKIEANDSSVLLYTAFELNENKFIESENLSSETKLVKLYLFKFAIKQYSKVLKNDVKKEENTLKNYNQELNGLIKNKEKLQKQITKFNSDIIIAKDQIRGFEYDLEMKQDQINQQKTKISEISPSNEELKKEQGSILKNFEREKKKLFKNIKKDQKDILNFKNGIQQNNLDIQTNLLEQKKSREKIQIQSEQVKKAEIRLQNLLNMQF